MYYAKTSSPFGNLAVFQEKDKIVRISFGDSDFKEGYTEELTPLLSDAISQLGEYFSGDRKGFSLPLEPNGTEFQKKVWNALINVPYGTTATYKDISNNVGSPKAFRAVGGANNKNPLPIVVPCHRIVGCSGKLIGYAYGLEMKERLLALEHENA